MHWTRSLSRGQLFNVLVTLVNDTFASLVEKKEF